MKDFLSHHGILGMKWGIRRYQNEDGSLTPEGHKRYAYSGLKKGKDTYTRYSHDNEKEIRPGAYISSTNDDYEHYGKNMINQAFLSYKDAYELTIKSHGDVKVADVNVVLDDVMRSIEKTPSRSNNNKQAKKAYKRLKEVGFFDNDNLTNHERYDLMVNTLKPKIKIPWKDSSYEEHYALVRGGALSDVVNDEIYKDRAAFAKKYRDQGYDAVMDPTDYIRGYESAQIITNPDKFKITSSKKLRIKREERW